MALKKSFRAKRVNAGYSSKMGSAEVTPPPPKGKVRVYHLTTAEFGISNIGLRRLKVARFSDLNDPFELMALSFRERITRKLVGDFRSTYDSHTGLLCFSSDWTNPVLWSHYSTKHRGICLGFDVKRDFIQTVEYQDERILAEFRKKEDPLSLSEELKTQLLRTKFKHWEYEEEKRAFVPLNEAIREGDLYFFPFSKDLQLAEVILGPKCNLSLDAVRQLARELHPHSVTFKARLAIKFFKVVPNGYTVP